MSFCQSCGAEVEPGSRFCQKCGTAVSGSPVGASSGGTGARGRGGSRALVLGAGAVVLIAVVGAVVWTMFFRPLSDEDYEQRAEEATFRIMDASDELNSLAMVWHDSDWDESFDDADLADAREGFDEMAAEMRAGHAELEALRVPESYEREHDALLSITEYFTTDFLDELDRAITEAEQGATKEELEDGFYDEWEDMYEDLYSVERDLERIEDLPFAEDVRDRLYGGF